MMIGRRGFLERVAGGCAAMATASALLPARLTRGPVAAAQAGERRVFELAIRNGRVPESDRTVRISQEDTVEIRWTADEATTVHLHGYDVEISLQPGEPALMTFDAHATGRFPVTIHHVDEHARGGGHGHGGAETTLLYLEVHPR